eukprot:SAG11_NODE_24806_length_368_cov_0.520446_1_plen_117_part_10
MAAGGGGDAAVTLFETRGETRKDDGPREENLLLDRLISAVFSRARHGASSAPWRKAPTMLRCDAAALIRCAGGSVSLRQSGLQLAARLEDILGSLRSGRNVGLLPSNYMLQPTQCPK